MTAKALIAGTRVATPNGRLGTVRKENRGHVTDTDHANFGREYVSVEMDPVDGDMGLGRFGRFFVDELRIDLLQPVAGACVAVDAGDLDACGHCSDCSPDASRLPLKDALAEAEQMHGWDFTGCRGIRPEDGPEVRSHWDDAAS